MEQQIHTLIRSLELHQPAPGISERILLRIRARARARIHARIAVFTAAAAGGFGAIGVLGSSLVRAVAQSGFSEYLSLAFSGGAALTFWKELGMALFESLPALSVIGILASLIFVIWAGANAVTDARRIGALAA